MRDQWWLATGSIFVNQRIIKEVEDENHNDPIVAFNARNCHLHFNFGRGKKISA
jgi:hypothetical protein